MKILHIESSIFAENGVSSQLTNHLIQTLVKQTPQAEVQVKRFANDPVPHLDGERLTAISTPEAERTAAQQALANYSDQQIAELQQADVLVLGLPMYNFNLPSMLKAWFDHIARAGVTFRYTETGPEGLLTGKKAYIVTTRGGIYKDTPSDSQVPFVTTFFNFIGITDIEFIYAEQLNMGDEPRTAAIASATKTIEQLVSA